MARPVEPREAAPCERSFTSPAIGSRVSGVLDLDLTDPEHVRDPYPVFRSLRETSPVHRSEHLGGWLLTRYADVDRAIRSPVLSVDTIRPFVAARAPHDPDVARLERLAPLWAVFNDPPDHTRLRAALQHGFTNRHVAALTGFVTEVARRLLDGLRDRQDAELVRDLAYPLPAMVIARLLGVADADVDRFKAWSDDLGEFVTTSSHADRYARAADAMEEMADHFGALVEARRRAPADDLLSGLVDALDRGVFVSQDELVSNCILLLFAGHETTTNLLVSGVYHLVRNPDQLQRLRDDPSLAALAVEELLRYDNPAHGLTRVALEDLEIGGVRIAKGDRVFAFVTAANRDPAVFSDPERLDVGRRPNRHLSFGAGIHFCLGAPLARLEAAIVLPLLLDRFADIRVVEEPTWKPLLVLRSIEALPVELEPT